MKKYFYLTLKNQVYNQKKNIYLREPPSYQAHKRKRKKPLFKTLKKNKKDLISAWICQKQTKMRELK
jgi:hypothetical protein